MCCFSEPWLSHQQRNYSTVLTVFCDAVDIWEQFQDTTRVTARYGNMVVVQHFVVAAPMTAKLHLLPAACPLFSPSKWALACGADFMRKPFTHGVPPQGSLPERIVCYSPLSNTLCYEVLLLADQAARAVRVSSLIAGSPRNFQMELPVVWPIEKTARSEMRTWIVVCSQSKTRFNS